MLAESICLTPDLACGLLSDALLRITEKLLPFPCYGWSSLYSDLEPDSIDLPRVSESSTGRIVPPFALFRSAGLSSDASFRFVCPIIMLISDRELETLLLLSSLLTNFVLTRSGSCCRMRPCRKFPLFLVFFPPSVLDALCEPCLPALILCSVWCLQIKNFETFHSLSGHGCSS